MSTMNEVDLTKTNAEHGHGRQRVNDTIVQSSTRNSRKRFGLGVGPNVVRVRKFEILHRIPKVQRNSKFKNKFTNLKIFPF